MRIDAHHHLWRYDPSAFRWIESGGLIARDFTVTELDRLRRDGGVDACIAIQARQHPDETSFLLRCATEAPWIVGVVGWIDLCNPEIDRLVAEEQSPLVVGYRHVVQDEADDRFLLRDDMVRGVGAVAARGLTYDILVNHSQLAHVPAFLNRIGDGRFVLDHAAKPDIRSRGWEPWAERVAAVAEHPQVWCKISGLVTEADHAAWSSDHIERYLEHLLASFGPDRLIWGSDWPVCTLAAPYQAVIDIVENFVARHCPAARNAIFAANAIRAYALPRARA